MSGNTAELFPARRFMQAAIARWLLDFRIDAIRIDSVNTIYSWDFVGEFSSYARDLFRARFREQGGDDNDADQRFLVAGEELSMPLELIRQHRVDALWNEPFKRRVRHAILGESDPDIGDFEQTVRRMINCCMDGFANGAQAINYVTSHDVEGCRNERLFDLLCNNHVYETEPRIKLAFACLLTAVGIPMILAGEEFADQSDLPVVFPQKEVDPVNFSRLEDAWRQRIFVYVQRLVRLRQTAGALSVDDVDFIHSDFTPGRRIIAWRRGGGDQDPIVVVANFSSWGTTNPTSPDAKYVVHGWPAVAPGRTWREATQDRDVPDAWVGREPLYPWEAKVYCLAETD